MKLHKNIKQNIIKIGIITLLISNIGIMLMMYLNHSVSENDTASYSGTIRSVIATELKHGVDIRIYTNEYNGPVMIFSTITKYIDINEIIELTINEHIYFTVEKDKYNPEDSLFVEAVEFAIDEKTIFTLQDYNSMMEKSLLFLKILIVIYSVMLIYIAFRLFSKKRVNK